MPMTQEELIGKITAENIIDKKGTLVAADCANDKVVQVIDLLLK